MAGLAPIVVGGLLATPGVLSADLWPAYPDGASGGAKCEVAVVSHKDAVTNVEVSGCSDVFADSVRSAAHKWQSVALDRPSPYVASWLVLEQPDEALYASFDVQFKRNGRVKVKAGEAVRVRKASYLSTDEDWYCVAVVSAGADGRTARVDAEDECPEKAIAALGVWQWSPLEIDGERRAYSVSVQLEGRQAASEQVDEMELDDAPPGFHGGLEPF